MGNKLYVGNLDVQTTTDDLTQLFAGAGHVVSTNIIMDRETGRSKGFGFIEMANEAEAREAIALYSGHELHSQALIVNQARPSEPQQSSETGAPATAARPPKFREVKHKRRGGGNIHRFH